MKSQEPAVFIFRYCFNRSGETMHEVSGTRSFYLNKT